MYLIKTKNIISFDNLFEEKECETYEESVYGKEEYKRRSRYFNFQGAGAGDFDDFLNPLPGNSTADAEIPETGQSDQHYEADIQCGDYGGRQW